MTEKSIPNLKEFYPYYLSEHQNATCRKLHFVGTSLVILLLACILITQTWWAFIGIPLIGYGFAWVGHYFYEQNKPATFQYPLYSLASDFILFWDLLTGKQPFNPISK